MATRNYVIIDSSQQGLGLTTGHYLIKWTGLLNGDVGNSIFAGDLANKSIHVTGTFGVGGSVAIEGSNQTADITDASANFIALRNSTHTAIAITSAATNMEEILENSLRIRPNVTAGDGTTSLTVWLLVQTPARR